MSAAGNVVAADLAAKINDFHSEAQRHAGDAIYCARRCGEELLEAKRKVGHGKFGRWITNNLKFGERQARRYMRLAQCWPELESVAEQNGHAVSDLSMRVALEQLSEPKSYTFDETISDNVTKPATKTSTTTTAESSKVAAQVPLEAHKAGSSASATGPDDSVLVIDGGHELPEPDIEPVRKSCDECVRDVTYAAREIPAELKAVRNALDDLIDLCAQVALDWQYALQHGGLDDAALKDATGISPDFIEQWSRYADDEAGKEAILDHVNAVLKQWLRVEFEAEE